jgi:hypothetical protein
MGTIKVRCLTAWSKDPPEFCLSLKESIRLGRVIAKDAAEQSACMRRHREANRTLAEAQSANPSSLSIHTVLLDKAADEAPAQVSDKTSPVEEFAPDPDTRAPPFHPTNPRSDPPSQTDHLNPGALPLAEDGATSPVPDVQPTHVVPQDNAVAGGLDSGPPALGDKLTGATTEENDAAGAFNLFLDCFSSRPPADEDFPAITHSYNIRHIEVLPEPGDYFLELQALEMYVLHIDQVSCLYSLLPRIRKEAKARAVERAKLIDAAHMAEIAAKRSWTGSFPHVSQS